MNINYCVEYMGDFREVSGTLLHDIAPHLASVATFAVGRGYGFDNYWWIVSNLETGRKVAYSTKRLHAIQQAAELLAGKTVAQVRGKYRKHLRICKALNGERQHD